ncbi:hypothetical protein A7K73_03065 [Candidatus Methylacidiphilum fumarolicum]|uniref:Uncharacterized protein n=2 Tax=Candidatus Methylacidiphilum fumarolicum TaxID=591154 RepID=I0JZN5_METFB|nr:hypothetical protein [Candidatus Methylacidiphilum fumarolicum]MBW6414610.1 hypothetical protein [Candidatus Methylacidiphilum fumarolicum]TFE70891.1 hypothetical protein A7K73_03065 [Candidatus Methylacidiphilum fumarolicum]TFE77388.1 hypothetical protein A7D33_04635 [Candidatus Methylacidiphilum fumarolicum]CAI9085260.1 conserved protein of unknown function [Candidatus Methylacidiphilum fumarolicum]CCG92704.1 conserved exported hypothetical protein [Methylacidiphilum fumariolicum SolV]
MAEKISCFLLYSFFYFWLIASSFAVPKEEKKEAKSPAPAAKIFVVAEYGPKLPPENLQNNVDRYMEKVSRTFDAYVQRSAAKKRMHLLPFSFTPLHGFVALGFYVSPLGVITEKVFFTDSGEMADLIEQCLREALVKMAVLDPPSKELQQEIGSGFWKFFCCWWPAQYEGLNDDLENAARLFNKGGNFGPGAGGGVPLEFHQRKK